MRFWLNRFLQICMSLVSLVMKFRSTHRRCSIREGVLRNFVKFTGKHLCQSLFFNNIVGPRAASVLKKRLWHRWFPVSFAKFLKTPFLQNTCGRLLLEIDSIIYAEYLYSHMKEVFSFEQIMSVLTFLQLVFSQKYLKTFFSYFIGFKKKLCGNIFIFMYWIFLWYIFIFMYGIFLWCCKKSCPKPVDCGFSYKTRACIVYANSEDYQAICHDISVFFVTFITKPVL